MSLMMPDGINVTLQSENGVLGLVSGWDQLVYIEITILYRDHSLMKGNRMQTLSMLVRKVYEVCVYSCLYE